MIKNGKIRHNYTIVELLVVILIMSILFGAASGSFSKMFISQGVIGAVRSTSSKLSMTRSLAVCKNRYVALLLPGDDIKTKTGNAITSGFNTNEDKKYLYEKSRVCFVKKSANNEFTFDSWIEGQEWEQLPAGTVAFIQSTKTTANPADVPSEAAVDSTPRKIKSVPIPSGNVEVPGIVYTPHGSLYGASNAVIKILRAHYDIPSDRILMDGKENYYLGWNGSNFSGTSAEKILGQNVGWDISINGYTGRGSYEKKH